MQNTLATQLQCANIQNILEAAQKQGKHHPKTP